MKRTLYASTVAVLIAVLILGTALSSVAGGVAPVGADSDAWTGEIQLTSETDTEATYVLQVCTLIDQAEVLLHLWFPATWEVRSVGSSEWYRLPASILSSVSLLGNLQASLDSGLVWLGRPAASTCLILTFAVDRVGSPAQPELRIYEQAQLVKTIRMPMSYRIYCPLVTAADASGLTRLTVDLNPHTRGVHSWGMSHAAAYDPAGGGVFLTTTGGGGATVVRTDEFLTGQYYLTRSFMDVPIPVFDGSVVSATLTFHVKAESSPLAVALPAPTVAFHIGTWPEGAGSDQLWGAWGQQVVSFDTEGWYGTGSGWEEGELVVVSLPLTVIQSGGRLRLVMRDSEDHLNLRTPGVDGSRFVYIQDHKSAQLVIVVAEEVE